MKKQEHTLTIPYDEEGFEEYRKMITVSVRPVVTGEYGTYNSPGMFRAVSQDMEIIRKIYIVLKKQVPHLVKGPIENYLISMPL